MNSCSEIKDNTQKHFDDDGLLTDLKLWQWARLYCGTDNPGRLNKAVLDNSSSATRNKAAHAASTSGKKNKEAIKKVHAGDGDNSIDIQIDSSVQVVLLFGA